LAKSVLSEAAVNRERQRCIVLVANYIIPEIFPLTRQNVSLWQTMVSATTTTNQRDAEARACAQTVDRRRSTFSSRSLTRLRTRTISCYHTPFYYNVDSYGGVINSSTLNVYPVRSTYHPLGARFAFVVSASGVYFGGDKQV
jgi:hypothetical protein